MDKTETVIGVIGGSGLYGMDGLTDTEWRRIDSPFGTPSDEVLFGRLGDVQMVFLPRHGRGHRISPSGINYRANIDVMKRAGCTDIISVSACGSFREELAPGCFVIVDQFIDRTFAREKSFFGNGLVAHVSMADPVCARLGDALEKAASDCGIDHVRGGTYLTMEGPQFSTRAESHLYRSWDCSVIGMTNMPEAKLAREAELCYATVAMVTDYDCWREEDAHVDVAAVLEVLTGNASKAQDLIAAAAPALSGSRNICHSGCDRALEVALITPPEARDEEMAVMLDAVAGRVLG
ncbi:S-methyl-5'-thioadenosine phosphorylase [Minwuia sp.]|uniref:S-methyl-5'-thioadenosine phosphorylase n=1 Tax=Minwuia sp. TaxID=2493630 RepID=UPI003A90002F